MTHPFPLFADIKARLERVTPGPWKATGGNRDTMGYYLISIEAEKKDVISGGWCTRKEGYPPDADFIAHAPADLAKCIEALTLEYEKNRIMREALEFYADDGHYYCDLDHDIECSVVFRDKGRQAREALARIHALGEK
jgi:hypothetical protein